MGAAMRWTDGFIAVDWGTTNRRAYRIDSSGERTDEFEDGKGVLSIQEAGFPQAIAEIRERLGDHPLLLAGMVGSNRGWVEAPYVPCPAGIDELVHALVWPGEREAIVPGLSYLGHGRADVMRGEEVQLLGALADGMIHADSGVCHPGTHNKWVLIRGGRIVNFLTVMTGELFNLLKEHSILSDLLANEVTTGESFGAGVRDAMDHGALPADLFGARARVLLGQLRAEDAASYISGLLIGTDARIGLTYPLLAQVTVIGRPELTRLYSAALAALGRDPLELDGEQCFLAGAKKIAELIT